MMAAEILAGAGHNVTVYDRMASPARKLLIAGRGGLNLTHSEPLEKFITRYGKASDWLSPHIQAFPPQALRAWCEGLGQETFVGSSGRVFPRSMKAVQLLRAWLQRLDKLGVRYMARHYWQGWEDEKLLFTNATQQKILVKADATLLALGGASWPRLGSDGSWVRILSECGVEIAPLRPANCGFVVPWSEHFSTRFAGEPLKSITLTHNAISHQGEAMITAQGIEGGAVYALSASLRNVIEKQGKAILQIDLRPGMTHEALTQKLQAPRGSKSISSYLRNAGFSPLAISLLREITPNEQLAQATPEFLASRLKSLPITLTATTGINRAISAAGGIKRSAVNDDFMLLAKPSIFAAGEMLNWEAPTGGYLLQACFSTTFAASQGVLKFLQTANYAAN